MLKKNKTPKKKKKEREKKTLKAHTPWFHSNGKNKVTQLNKKKLTKQHTKKKKNNSQQHRLKTRAN